MCKNSVSCIFIVLMAALAAGTAHAGVEFADPAGGWTYMYQGDKAVAGAAFTALDGTWSHDNGSDSWDGSPIGTGAPGGASALAEGDVTFLRIQDCGDPRPNPADPSNRKIMFGHLMSGEGDAALAQNILDNGITVTFRARIATSGLLDQLNSGGTKTPYPSGGDGYVPHDGGKANFCIRQVNGDKIISFALALASDDEEMAGKNGLTMNKLNGTAPTGAVDMQGTEPGTVNILELDPTQWHEFWITIQADPTGAGTHMATIYVDGSTDPEVFYVTAGDGDDYSESYIAMGVGATPQSGAIDIDFLAYKAGLNTPVPASSELAWRPTPGNGDDDVDPDVVLSWNPGDFARTHDVYFGTNRDDVANAGVGDPRGVLAQAGQDANTFDPGRLELGATYYWRVDEVGAAPDSTVYKGDVWSFTTEPVGYLITDVQATASSSANADVAPANTVNRSGLTEAADGTGAWVHDIKDSHMWQCAMDGLPATIAFEFDRAYKLHEMKVWNHNTVNESFLGLGAREVTIEIADSNEGPWTLLADVALTKALGQPDSPATDTIPMNGVMASNVRLTIHSNHATFQMSAAGLAEVQFFYIPVAPRELTPADGTTLADTEVTLRWRSGREAAQHEVYLDVNDNLALVEGSDPAVLVATPAAEGRYGSYTASGLNLGQTYVWKVVEVNTVETPATYNSPVFSFTTPDFRVIDDMESYQNMEPMEIWATWLDGTEFGTNDPTNGSVVGANPGAGDYNAAVGRTGGQSLPIWFTNTATAPKSEAARSLQPGRDWTQSGIKSLSLWFRGDPTNSGNGRFYVKINNSAPIYYDGDSTDLAKGSWQPFNIDLSQIGVAVTNVTKLAVGIDGVGANGVVYIDDIRLYPRTPEYITPVQPDTANLLAYWDFENNANDRSGHNINGQLVSAQLVTPGKQGMAVQLDGTGHVDLGNPPLLDFGTGDWTLTAWFKTTMASGVATGTIFAKGGDDTGGHRYALAIDEVTDGAVSLTCDDNVTKEQANATTVSNDDQWHFVVGQRQGDSIKIYIDGQLEDTESVDATYDLSGTSQHKAYIGVITSNNDASLVKRFVGLIDEVRVYNRALSEAEILGLAGKTVPVPKPF